MRHAAGSRRGFHRHEPSCPWRCAGGSPPLHPPRPGTPAPRCGRRVRASRRPPGACPTGSRQAGGRSGRSPGWSGEHNRQNRRHRSRRCVPRRRGAAFSCWTPWPRAACAPARTPSCIARRDRETRPACSCLSPRCRMPPRRADRSSAATCARQTECRRRWKNHCDKPCSAIADDPSDDDTHSRSCNHSLDTPVFRPSWANAAAETRSRRRSRTSA